MGRWIYPGLALGWAASMIYEWAQCGGRLVQYAAWAVIGVTVLAGLLLRGMMKGEPKGRAPRAMVWFLLAAVVCVAFFKFGVETAVWLEPPHVRMLPMYLVMFLDFLAAGCYTLWRKRRIGKG